MLAAMSSTLVFRLTILLLLVAVGSGCSGISALDATGDAQTAGAPGLSQGEQAAVRSQVSRAVDAGRWKIAWNQEVEAGADRAALERIALGALHDDSRHAEDMLTALRERWGALSSDGRAQVSGWVVEATAEGRWRRALGLELLSADDPPAFTRAWALYQGAPVELAPELLDDIQGAREDYAEDHAKEGD